MRARVLLFVVLLLQLAPGALPVAAAPAPVIRENLEYQISLGPWSNVARAHIVLKELEPGYYLGEFSVAAQGMWKLLSRWLPEGYQTEMAHREGKLQPLVYREEFQEKGQHVLKEYRFDYDHSLLTRWRQIDGGEKVKEWEVPLKGPIYDLLSLLFNLRLGALGPMPAGATVRVMVLPTLEPEELVFRIGAVTDQGFKVMAHFCEAGVEEEVGYFMFFNPDRVVLTWTRPTLLGDLSSRLLNPGEIWKEGLLALPSSSAPVPKAQP